MQSLEIEIGGSPKQGLMQGGANIQGSSMQGGYTPFTELLKDY